MKNTWQNNEAALQAEALLHIDEIIEKGKNMIGANSYVCCYFGDSGNFVVTECRIDHQPATAHYAFGQPTEPLTPGEVRNIILKGPFGPPGK